MSDRPTLTTWEDKAGPIFGEFSFMCDRDWLDEQDDPTEAIRTDWVAVRRQEIHRSNPDPLCPVCHDEGEIDERTCERCGGYGVVETFEEVVSDETWDDRHGAGDAGLSELIAANVVGELEGIAATLDYAPRAQAALRKIAAGIRQAMAQDRGSQGSSTGDGEDGTERPVPTPWDPHGREGES